jgi:hypothetical protein
MRIDSVKYNGEVEKEKKWDVPVNLNVINMWFGSDWNTDGEKIISKAHDWQTCLPFLTSMW